MIAEVKFESLFESQHADSRQPAPKAVIKFYKPILLMSLAGIMAGIAITAISSFNSGTEKNLLTERLSGVGVDQGIPSIAVLPFKNISNEPQQDYFSDGMTADLITDLSKLSGLSVIARNSSFVYRNEDVDIRRIGQELGVRYVLEGSVRKAGNSVRISTRLIDASNGFSLWADRFDDTLENVFLVQDQVTAKIVEALKLTLTENERNQMIHRYTNSVQAYDHFLQGWQYFWNRSREGNAQARQSYLEAIKLDKKFARAYANLALTYSYDYLNGWSDHPERDLDRANEYADKAVELDETLPQAYWAQGVTQVYSRNYEDALETARKALALEPNYADGHGLLATVLNYAGKPREALAEIEKAMRLNPRYPSIYRAMRGEMYFNMRDYDRAIDDFVYALEVNPEPQEPRIWLAAAYAHVGLIDEAEWQVTQIKSLDESLTLGRFEEVIPIKDPGQRKNLIDGLYLAGLR